MTQDISIRPATELDLPALVLLPFSGGLKLKHRERLERQENGTVVYLLATLEGEPIGHLLLKWDCPEHEHVRAVAPPCAEVEDFVVAPELRGKGIGTAMLDEAANLCRQQGVDRMGLGVGFGNPEAREFYVRRGFEAIPGSEHRVTWRTPDSDDPSRDVEAFDDCMYMTREIS